MAFKKRAAKISLVSAESAQPEVLIKEKKTKPPFNPYHTELAALEIHDRIPTGIAPIDIPTHGGIPKGAVTLLTGVSGSGKTTLTLLGIAGFQKQEPKKKALYLNAENKIDVGWAKIHGVDPSRMTVYWPENIEESQYIIRDTLKNREDVGLIAVDSLASLSPLTEANAEPTKEEMGGAAKNNNKFFRQLASIQNHLVSINRPCTIIVINQERQSIGPFPMRVIPGGMGQIFQSCLWIQFNKSEYTLHPDLKFPLKSLIRYSIKKNLEATAEWPGEFYLHVTPHGDWNVGDIEDHGFVWHWATNQLGLFRNAGSKGYEFEKKFHHKEEFIQAWRADPALYARIKKLLGEAFISWKNSKVKPQLKSQDNTGEDQDAELAEIGEVLGGAIGGETAAGLGE